MDLTDYAERINALSGKFSFGGNSLSIRPYTGLCRIPDEASYADHGYISVCNLNLDGPPDKSVTFRSQVADLITQVTGLKAMTWPQDSGVAFPFPRNADEIKAQLEILEKLPSGPLENLPRISPSGAAADPQGYDAGKKAMLDYPNNIRN